MPSARACAEANLQGASHGKGLECCPRTGRRAPSPSPYLRLPCVVLTDQQVEEIRRGVEAGMRGPVLLKWVRELLADRDERLAQERRVLPDPHGTPGR